MKELEELEYAKEKYNMTEEEIENMYEQVRRLIFGNTLPEKAAQPLAIITGGQPGSGKSGIVVKSRLDFAETGREAVILDVDTYRGLYKKSAELAREFPQFYSEITDPTVGKIMAKLADETVFKGYNFIFEGTLGNTAIIKTIRSSNINYRIIAKIIGVSRFESLLSIFERYIEMNKSMGFGRLTTIEAHDVRYNNFTKIASTLEGENIEVEVYKRALDRKVPIRVYKTGDNSPMYPSVIEALIDSRQESYRLCMKDAKQRLELINKEIKYNTVDGKILGELEKLNNIFTKEFAKLDINHEK